MLSEYKEKLIKAIERHFPAAKIYLFGSRATGTNAPASDIDIAVDLGRKVDFAVIGKIKEEIDDLNIPFFVDVVDIYSVPEGMKKQIIEEGILWKS